MNHGFKGGGGGVFPPTLIPMLAIRFYMVMLWDLTDEGLIGFFRKGLKEDLASWWNPKDEFRRYIMGSRGSLTTKIESTNISKVSKNSLPTWTTKWEAPKLGLPGGEDIWRSLRFLHVRRFSGSDYTRVHLESGLLLICLIVDARYLSCGFSRWK
jgi:hypothetical protein